MKLIGEILVHFVTKRTWRGEKGHCLIEVFFEPLDAGADRIFVGQITHPEKGMPWYFHPANGPREKFTSCVKAWSRAYAYAAQTELGKIHNERMFGDAA